jgi:hypothetical protein
METIATAVVGVIALALHAEELTARVKYRDLKESVSSWME